MSTECPACGSSDLDVVESQRSIDVVYGEPAEIVERVVHCKTCGESGDFEGENDAAIEAAYEAAKKRSVAHILKAMASTGLTMAHMERALELPARTLARWKAGDASASGVALLRILRTFPWILEVADADFETAIAQRKVLEQAGLILQSAIADHSDHAQITVMEGTDKVDVHASFHLSEPPQGRQWLEQPRLVATATAGE